MNQPDVKEVEIGIDRVYSALKSNRLFIFSTLAGVLSEIESYSREVDATGEPTERISNKSTYHHLDALRYVVGSVINNDWAMW